MKIVDRKNLFYLNILSVLMFIHSRNTLTITQTVLKKVLPAVCERKTDDAYFNIILMVHPFIYTILIAIFQTLLHVLKTLFILKQILPNII